MIDYKELGLKSGLEFHQRLDTHKLFCNCESGYGEEQVHDAVSRKLRPVAGELGIVDPAAILEYSRNKTFNYQILNKNSCLVELDEEPPHPMNGDALDTALEISMLLNCDIVDQVHIMRKIVIDGSNTAGFQRSALISQSGTMKSKYGDIPITGVYLEEEACGIVSEKDGVKTYRLDRLGIPLTEISTGIMYLEPKDVKEVALELGTLLRITGRVQRGIGSIRQDVNLSIKNGARVEIKGVQEIRILDIIMEKEIERQLNLLKLKNEIKGRGISDVNAEILDFTKYFSKTDSKILKDKKVFGLILPHFEGIFGFQLTKERRFGSELASIARSFGLGGIIHSDEDLSRYSITKEMTALRKDHKMTEDTAFILVAGPEVAREALARILIRINQALEGIPEETRRALEDGNTEFMRPLPGEARLYPETDIAPVPITEKRLKEIKAMLPEDPEKLLKKLKTEYKLSDELAQRMLTSKYAMLFYDLTNKVLFDPNFVAVTLLNTLTTLRRDGFDIEKLTPEELREIFKAVKEEKITKKAVPDVLKKILTQPQSRISGLLEEFEKASEGDLEKDVDLLIEEHKDLAKDKQRAFNVMMGELMAKYKGQIEGNVIAKTLKKKLKI